MLGYHFGPLFGSASPLRVYVAPHSCCTECMANTGGWGHQPTAELLLWGARTKQRWKSASSRQGRQNGQSPGEALLSAVEVVLVRYIRWAHTLRMQRRLDNGIDQTNSQPLADGRVNGGGAASRAPSAAMDERCASAVGRLEAGVEAELGRVWQKQGMQVGEQGLLAECAVGAC